MRISVHILSILYLIVITLQSFQTRIVIPSFKATRIGKSVSSSTPTEDLQVTSLKTCTNECLKTNCKAFSFQAKAPSSSIDRSCQIVKEFHSWNTTDDFLKDDNTFMFYEVLPKWNVFETTPLSVNKPYGSRIIDLQNGWWSYAYELFYKIPINLQENDIMVADFCLYDEHFIDQMSTYFVGVFNGKKLLLRLKIYPTRHQIYVAYKETMSSSVQKVFYDSSTPQGKMIQSGFCYHATILLAPNESIVTLNGVMLAQVPRYYHPSEIINVRIDNRGILLPPSATCYIL
ncbi:uncharacterized protein LOC143231560 [Tachypleus tridentatus]|uniref:uncharacterized protein LOC143231560 n=1 Tax=Tachypleus tridentatus TaxID=6853 RepID=UPI003FCF9B14